MFTSPFRPLTFGEILDGAFTLYRRHFLTFFITALIPYIPIGIVSGWFSTTTGAAGEEPSLEFVGLAFLLMIVSLLGVVVMLGALTRQASQAYTGGEVALGDGFRHGLRSFFRLLVSSVVAYFMMGVVSTPVVMIFAVVTALLVPTAGESAVLFGLLMVVMLLAMLAVMVCVAALCFAIGPAIVLERRGPFDAIGRSFSLAWGALPRVAGVVLVTVLIVLLPVVGAMVAVGLAGGFAETLSGGGSPAAIAVQQLLTTLGYALTFPFFTAAMVLLYYDRRARTEAHDLEGMVQGLALAR